MVNKIKDLGYECIETRKGGVLACLGGEGEPLVITAHLDGIGLMVRHIKKDGTLMVCPVGGLHAESALGENIRLHTRDGKIITGAVQRDRASVHVTPDKYFEIAPDYEENVVDVLDIFTPHYGSDGDTSIVAGHDIRHACVGPGTRATHGYERSHIDGMNNTYALILSYITE